MVKPQTGMQKLVPVENTNLNERVYSQLRESIMSGHFRPGEVLTLRGLAAALGTSIMPARDAVLRLTVERALESTGRGVRIPMLNIDAMRDVLRFRLALEGEAAALAAERATPAEILSIVQASARVEKAQSQDQIKKFVAANQEFHFSVYRAAHSPLLQSMIETLWLQIGPHLANLVDAGQGVQLSSIDMGKHADLLAALRARDGEAARRALCADLADSTDIFQPYQAAPIEAALVVKRQRARP
jgi:DNA-binding GntR family transcriptional regulator